MKAILSDIADIVAGYPFRGSISESCASDIVVVQPKNVSSEYGIDYKNCLRTELPGKKSPDFLDSTDVIINARSEPFHSANVGNGFEIIKVKAVSSPYFFVIKLKVKDILPEYLSWYINQYPVQTYFQKNSEGSMHKSLRREILENCPIAYPELEKQSQIIALSENFKQQRVIYETLIQQSKLLEKQIAKNLDDSQILI